MVTHSSVLAWRIPGTGEPGGLPSMGSHRVGHDRSHLAAAAQSGLQFLISRCPLLLLNVTPHGFSGHRSAIYEFGPLFVFVNSFTGTQSHPCIYVFVSGCFCSITAELSGCDTDCMACKAEHIYHLTFYRKSWLTSSFEKMAFLYFF